MYKNKNNSFPAFEPASFSGKKKEKKQKTCQYVNPKVKNGCRNNLYRINHC
jgi:hypothetical protein